MLFKLADFLVEHGDLSALLAALAVVGLVWLERRVRSLEGAQRETNGTLKEMSKNVRTILDCILNHGAPQSTRAEADRPCEPSDES